MAFLDNSGDIILDAVLTDAGRARLARGDGSFRIAKYAFGDDEINYGNYDPNNVSGSAYYDLDILQTPILEAFTNNIASVKSKLMTLTNNNLLYLPVIVLNTKANNPLNFAPSLAGAIASGTYAILVDIKSVNTFGSNSTTAPLQNYINGFSGPKETDAGGGIRLDQGLNTIEISNAFNLDAELTENNYIIQIDNRFGTICDTSGQAINPSFIDDDNIASYYVSSAGTGNKAPFVENLPALPIGGEDDDNSVIAGPRGTKLQFSILSSVSLRTSTFLFDQVGTSTSYHVGDVPFQFIDSIVKVEGATTGYVVEVPVRFIKATA